MEGGEGLGRGEEGKGRKRGMGREGKGGNSAFVFLGGG